MSTTVFFNRSGLTLIELVIAMAIMAILASVILPMAEVSVTRTKELELRRSLRLIRDAIDDYKKDHDRAVAEKKIPDMIDETGYPESLEDLVEGDDWGGMYSFKKRYLRRLPKDPFDKYDDGWGECSYEDEPPCSSKGGKDLYDVSSQSYDYALDGSPYNMW